MSKGNYEPINLFAGLSLTPKPQPATTTTQQTPTPSQPQPVQPQDKQPPVASSGMPGLFSGLKVQSPNTSITQQSPNTSFDSKPTQPQSSMFVGLQFAATQPNTQPPAKLPDIFAQLNVKSTIESKGPSIQDMNPYATQALGDFAQNPAKMLPLAMTVPRIEPQPQQSSLQTKPQVKEEVDPFADALPQKQPEPKASQAIDKPKAESGGFLSSAFGFMGFNKSKPAEQPQKQPQAVPQQNQVDQTGQEQKSLPQKSADDSLSTIQHESFQDNEKEISINEAEKSQVQETNNTGDYLPPTPSAFGFLSQSTTEQPVPSMFSFLTMSGSQPQTQPTQQKPRAESEDFEEVAESRDIIEEKLFRTKLMVINLTLSQNALSANIATLHSDIQQLQSHYQEIQSQIDEAASRDDFEQAEALNQKLSSMRQMATQKESQIRKLHEDQTCLESRKSDKQMDLVNQINANMQKLLDLKYSQEHEMKQYQETEQLAVDEKRKRLHYERIRINEDQSELDKMVAECEQAEAEIDAKVYEDTKDKQGEKHRINNQIDEIDQEIEQLENQIAILRKNREMCVLERGVYEKQITQARSKYLIQINKNQVLRHKFDKTRAKLKEDDEAYNTENESLQQYEDHFKTKLRALETEVNDLKNLEQYLQETTDRLSNTVSKKMASLDRQNLLRQERHSLETKFHNQKASRQYNFDKIEKAKQSLMRTMEYIETLHDGIRKIEAEKKELAAQRKFKEAANCQGRVKQVQNEIDERMQNYGTLQRTVIDMEDQARNKVGEFEKMESRLKELDREIDTEHMENYLVYRLEDVRDLVNSLRPYTKDTQESCLISRNDAIQKMSVLEGEVRKMEQELESLQRKYGVTVTTFAAKEEDGEEVTQPAAIEEPIEQVIEEEKHDDVPDLNQIISEIYLTEGEIAGVEALIEQAVEDEDFDKADQLQQKVEILKEKAARLEALKSSVPAQSEYQALEL